MMRPGAAHLITMTAVGNYCSHIPEEGPRGANGCLHTMTNGRRGRVLCYSCQEPGHVIANCPHRAKSKGAPGIAVAYQARHICTPTTVRTTWRMQWMSTDDWRRQRQRKDKWASTQKQNSSCVIVLTWLLPMHPERQRLGARAERCTPCPCHLCKEVMETQAEIGRAHV